MNEIEPSPPETGDAGDAPESGSGRTLASNEISPELLHDPYGEEQLDVSRDAFQEMLASHQTARGDIKEGEIVKARVLRTTDSSVILEFGFKSEGSVSLDEFKDPDSVEPGQEVEVLLESLEDDDGVVVLSKKKADFLRVWELIRDAHESDRPVKGLLTRKIKGGVTVDIMGVDAFLPGSQIALRRVPNIEDLIGDRYDFKIIKLNKRRRNIVVSRRIILEQERAKKRSTLVKELLKGQVREGVVKNITDFGAFIDLGGLDGLLHITDMSWGRVSHPSEVVKVGGNLDVKVLDIDWDRERISLGLKQLLPYPWTDIEDRYPVGARVAGRVVSITNYGAFIELQKGVEGLVHISEMSWTRNVRHPSKLVSISDEIEAVVLKVDPQEEKISLGMKQIEEDPWLALPVKYPTGTRLKGTVRNLTTFGAFVEIEPGIDGLVHVSDMSWTKRVEHPSEVVRKGEETEVMVLAVDSDNKRISLGFKQLYDDPWPTLVTKYVRGHEQDGTIARLQDKGVVVDLGEGVEGFVPGSHAGVPVDALSDYFRVGESVPLRVIASDADERRIVLEVLEPPARGATEEVAEEPAEEAVEDVAEEAAEEAVEEVAEDAAVESDDDAGEDAEDDTAGEDTGDAAADESAEDDDADETGQGDDAGEDAEDDTVGEDTEDAAADAGEDIADDDPGDDSEGDDAAGDDSEDDDTGDDTEGGDVGDDPEDDAAGDNSEGDAAGEDTVDAAGDDSEDGDGED
ncbi:MAG: 30S ribosomal protein S1 [Gemmatimonadetes bacterium]|nr:30S ribosomal protein S1 [Gemmatimonadota bacterium]